MLQTGQSTSLHSEKLSDVNTIWFCKSSSAEKFFMLVSCNYSDEPLHKYWYHIVEFEELGLWKRHDH